MSSNFNTCLNFRALENVGYQKFQVSMIEIESKLDYVNWIPNGIIPKLHENEKFPK